MHRNRRVLAVLLLSWLPAAALWAQDAGHPCARVLDAGERLACYDRAFPPAAGAQAAPPSQQERQARAREDFGLAGRGEPAQSPDRIDGSIARLGQLPSGERTVQLDNGQTWILTEAGKRGILKVGDAVSVRKAALGSFMLRTPAGLDLRARRAR